MNYTKGKWTVSYNGRIEDREHFSVTTDTIQVAEVHPRRDGKEAEANARLISAAPDMYEALKQAQEGTGDWRGMIDSALARAENK